MKLGFGIIMHSVRQTGVIDGWRKLVFRTKRIWQALFTLVLRSAISKWTQSSEVIFNFPKSYRLSYIKVVENCLRLFRQQTIMWQKMWQKCVRKTCSGRAKMAVIFQTKYSFLNENIQISIKILPCLFPGVKLKIYQHWFRWWLDGGQATSHCLNQ